MKAASHVYSCEGVRQMTEVSVLSSVIVTGSSGLIGSEAVKFFHGQGFDVVGIDNNMREYFFGPDASVNWKTAQLVASLPRFRHMATDVRDASSH